MKKKLISLLAVLLMSVASYAQFESGKFYGGLSVTGLDISYNKADKWNVGIGGQLGYMFEDCWMVLANLDYSYQNEHSNLAIGPAVRYYIAANGIYLGAGTKFVHHLCSVDELMPHLNVGYAFFLNRTMVLEPEIYYNHSFKNHDYSGIGFKLGLGIIF